MRLVGFLPLVLSIFVAAQEKPAAKKSEPTPEIVLTNKVLKVIHQLDQIERESWWVLTGQRPPATLSHTGKLERALITFAGKKLTQKSLFQCDKYAVEYNRSPIYIGSWFVKESCRASTPENIIVLQLKELPKGLWQGDIEFHSGAWPEVVGLNVSILNPLVKMKFKTDEKGQIADFQFDGFRRARSIAEIVELKTFEYYRNDKSMIRLKGKVMENLQPKSTIESEVPLDGKIHVVEKVLPPPVQPKKPQPALLPKPPPTPPPNPNVPPSPPPGAAQGSQNGDMDMQQVEPQDSANRDQPQQNQAPPSDWDQNGQGGQPGQTGQADPTQNGNAPNESQQQQQREGAPPPSPAPRLAPSAPPLAPSAPPLPTR